MKKALTRILGLVLCFALLFAMIPATQAFAEGTIYRHWDSASGTLSFNTTAEGGTAITTLSTDTVLGNETSRSKVLRVVFFCDIQISDGYMLFNGFTNLREIEGMSHVKTATVTDMRGMFKNCNSLTAIDLSYFDTTAVTKMSEMFSGCKSLKTLDLSQINTAKVTETYAMFRECSGLEKLDVGKFDTTYVTDMNGMFYGCSGLKTLDVSNFDTARVTDMGSMFCGCNGLTKLSLSNFDTSRVKSMWWMFSGCKNLTSIDMTGWNTANVGYCSYMFNGCSSLTELDVSTLNFSKGSLEMENMFQNCSSLHKLTVGAKFGYYANPDREARFPVDMVLSSGAQAFKAGSIIPQDITAKRTYIAAVEVKFNANGGKGTMSSQVFRFDEGSKALNANAFTKSGVSFVGWNTKADGTGTSYTDKQVLNYAKLGVSLTLYAQWKAVKPKITTQPVSVTASVGDKATFTVAASGSTLAGQDPRQGLGRREQYLYHRREDGDDGRARDAREKRLSVPLRRDERWRLDRQPGRGAVRARHQAHHHQTARQHLRDRRLDGEIHRRGERNRSQLPVAGQAVRRLGERDEHQLQRHADRDADGSRHLRAQRQPVPLRCEKRQGQRHELCCDTDDHRGRLAERHQAA